MSQRLEAEVALNNHLESLSDLPRIAWEGREFSPNKDEMYLRPTNMPTRAQALGLANGDTAMSPGIYEIDVFAPTGSGNGAVLALADRIAKHFLAAARGPGLVNGDSTVNLGIPTVEPTTPDDTRLRVSVLVPYNNFYKE